MLRTFMHSKIHRATVTDSDLNYIGSLTLSPELLDAAGIGTNELVQVVNHVDEQNRVLSQGNVASNEPGAAQEPKMFRSLAKRTVLEWLADQLRALPPPRRHFSKHWGHYAHYHVASGRGCSPRRGNRQHRTEG
jgi:hypothetical protein